MHLNSTLQDASGRRWLLHAARRIRASVRSLPTCVLAHVCPPMRPRAAFPERQLLATGDYEGRITIWNLFTGEKRMSLFHRCVQLHAF